MREWCGAHGDLWCRYEELLLQPAATTQRVADFLGPDAVRADKLEYMLSHAEELVRRVSLLCERVVVEWACFAWFLTVC